MLVISMMKLNNPSSDSDSKCIVRSEMTVIHIKMVTGDSVKFDTGLKRFGVELLLWI
jgi:hypothetical protein